ncbi:serine-rich adhesin for platelets-like isoform X1 [Dreissena polymorpha]|uniref:serine-rich adhesin for platelets-like isoform X1 n=1 Tax=Dreissena polymorpha TaxID=45954 RepID=UPI002264823A|nr:serine-rich adhesin for platelets-like isoform X1 [Dreissena polymorpha]
MSRTTHSIVCLLLVLCRFLGMSSSTVESTTITRASVTDESSTTDKSTSVTVAFTSVTVYSSTDDFSTSASVTIDSSTDGLSTSASVTVDPSTHDLSTSASVTSDLSTDDLSTSASVTVDSSTDDLSTSSSVTADSSTADLSTSATVALSSVTANSSTADSSTSASVTSDSSTADLSTSATVALSSVTGDSSTADLSTSASVTADSSTADLSTSATVALTSVTDESSTTDILTSTTDISTSTTDRSTSTTDISTSTTDISTSTTDISTSKTVESTSTNVGSSSTTVHLTSHIVDSSSTTVGPSTTTKGSSSISEVSKSTSGLSNTSSSERTTQSTLLPITTESLVSSVNISSILMYISANLTVSGEGLAYNISTEQELVQKFVTEMSILLNTTGFRGIRLTKLNDSEWLGYTHRRKRSLTYIVFHFSLVYLGGTNLSLVNVSLPTTVNLTLLGGVATVHDLEHLKVAIKQAENKLNEDVCSVYTSVEKCSKESYKCTLSEGMVICKHACFDYNRCGDNGECHYDDIKKGTMCRCKVDDRRSYYTGTDCSVETYKLALQPEAVIGISAGLGVALLLVILVLVVKIIRNGKKASKKEENSYKLSGFEREGESPWEPKHYDDLWQHRHLGTDTNIFDERPYTATQDNLGNPMYMYRPDNGSEHQYSELKPGSSLSSLNLPETKFEISRPKIILGR